MRLSLGSILLFLSLGGIGTCADNPCDEDNPCAEGCCLKLSSIYGYGPSYCSSENCITAASANGACAHLAECDPVSFPGWGDSWSSDYREAENCPLNVCCSEYGFCGTTEDFCGDSSVAEPVCNGTSSSKRTIAYYEGWNFKRACDTMAPEDIPISGYIYINFAFLFINPDLYTIVPIESSQQQLYSRVVALKKRKPDLKVWISIGGWSFNDPGVTANTFSDLAASKSKQSIFFQLVLSFLDKYGFDGVDLDWEYPVAEERGGREADYDNFVTFLANFRSALDGADEGYGLTITLPSSYWYLQHFDIIKLEKSVDWPLTSISTNHSADEGWDADNEWIGSVVNAHTNLIEIISAMDLLWRNDIDPAKVVMGLGFYGRSFTLEDPSCVSSGCLFSDTGKPGKCTDSSGMLLFNEIQAILRDDRRNAKKVYDEQSAVQIVIFDENQLVSYDDWKFFEAKLEYANSYCIGGIMGWAVSLDADGTATNGLTGAVNLFPSDDGSHGGENDIYIGLDLWTNDTAEVACNPPCTLILPPFPLSTPVIISWPEYVKSIASSSAGAIYTKMIMISIEPFELTKILFWPITVAGSAQYQALFSPTQSIAPPTTKIVVGPTLATFPLYHTDYSANMNSTLTILTSTSSVSTPIAVQTGINPAVGSDCSGLWIDEYYCTGSFMLFPTTTGTLAPVFFGQSHKITIAPQPTVTSIQPPGTRVLVVTYSNGDAPLSDGCSAGEALPGCGSINCKLFGCEGECGLFPCDGGCGLGFCGGGCGLDACGPGCGEEGGCIQAGGGGDVGSEDTNPDESSTSCTSTASPTVTTICDYACKDTSDTCSTLCTSLTVTEACEPTAGSANLQIGDVIADDVGDVYEASDKDIEAEGNSLASWLNPFYTDWDPVLISGTTLTISATPPDVATNTATKTTQTVISVTSCDLKTTSTGSSSKQSTYFACDGGYGLSLSTKTNARRSTYLICDAYPPLTITTIEPAPSTTITKTPSETGGSGSGSGKSIDCPLVGSCTASEYNDSMYVIIGKTDVVFVKGTFTEGGMVDGGTAEICGDETVFSVDGDVITGKICGSGNSFKCTKSSEVTELLEDTGDGLLGDWGIQASWMCDAMCT
ncbi:hypothetical protein BDV06DRAFT_231555 [Aspergillus oleicola]